MGIFKKTITSAFALILISGLSIAHAETNFGSTTFSAWRNGKAVATVTASRMSVGWFQVTRKNYATSTLTVSDPIKSDGKPAYGYVQATYKYTWWRTGPGNVKIPSVATGYGNYAQSPVTSSRWSGYVGSEFNATPHYKKGIIVGVCQEIPWSPDACNSIYRESIK